MVEWDGVAQGSLESVEKDRQRGHDMLARLSRRNDGIVEGMYFKVLDPSTVGVTDPDSDEELGGQFKRVRIVMRAFDEPEYVEQVERLRINPNSPRPLATSDSIVSRGDPFEQAEPGEIEVTESVTVWE